MSTSIQAVIWDLDGVILDSANEHLRAWKRLADEEGIVFTDSDFWATFGKRNNDIIPHYWHVTSAEHLQDLADRKEIYFREFVRETASFLPGAEELMRDLHEAGFAQALASSTPVVNIKLISEILGLERYLSKFGSGSTCYFAEGDGVIAGCISNITFVVITVLVFIADAIIFVVYKVIFLPAFVDVNAQGIVRLFAGALHQ